MSLVFGNHRWTVASLASVGLLTACGGADVANPTVPVLSYTDAFVVQPIDGRDMTLAGIELSVEGGAVELVSVEGAFAETIELHTMAMQDGRMRMRQVESFTLSDDSPLSLKRGSDHLMVFGVNEPLNLGDSVDLTFTFETEQGQTTLVADAEVRSLVD